MKNNYLLYFLYFLIISGYYLLIFKNNKFNTSKFVLLVCVIIFIYFINNKSEENFISYYDSKDKLYKQYNTNEKIIPNNKVEKNDYKLIEKNKLYVSQGVTHPLKPEINKYQDTSKTSLKGLNDNPEDMFIFSYNKCKPECCLNGSNYSCNSGCVCVNDEQIKFLSSRGNNIL